MTIVFKEVAVFMKAAGQTIPTCNVDRSIQSDLYMSLIKEEYSELMEAEAVSDDVEICDACFDLIWVIVGYMHSRGWDCEQIWNEGALSNLEKIDRKTGKVIKREDGKVLKPEGWQPPNFSKHVSTLPE
jgi:predicted HAD superfamily Cof-like phosphohydrolase